MASASLAAMGLAVSLTMMGCAYGGPPCLDGGSAETLVEKHFEGEAACLGDPLCGFRVVTGSARPTMSLQAGEHGLELASGTEIAEAQSILLPTPGRGSGRDEAVSMLVRCDNGARLEVEELVSENIVDGANQADARRDTPTVDVRPQDAGRDAGTVDAQPVDASVDAGGPDNGSDASASEDTSAADDASMAEAGSDDAGTTDASLDDASSADASDMEDASLADAGIDAGFEPADAGVLPDSGTTATQPPRLRIGTTTFAAGSSWSSMRQTFRTQSAETGTVVSSTLLNLRIRVLGNGSCSIDEFRYQSIPTFCGR